MFEEASCLSLNPSEMSFCWILVLVCQEWRCLVSTWFCCHAMLVWNGPCVGKMWAVWLLSAVPTADPLQEMAVALASRMFGTGKELLKWCWLSLISHPAVKKYSVEYTDYCPSVWLLHYQRMLFSACLWEQMCCTYQSVGKSGPLHQSLELKSRWAWPK